MQVRITGQRKKNVSSHCRGAGGGRKQSPLCNMEAPLSDSRAPWQAYIVAGNSISTFSQNHISNICERTLSAALLTMGSFDLYMERKFPKGNNSRTEARQRSSLQPDAGKTISPHKIIRVHGAEVNKVCKMEVGSKRLMRCVKTKGNDPWLMSLCQHTIKCSEFLW